MISADFLYVSILPTLSISGRPLENVRFLDLFQTRLSTWDVCILFSGHIDPKSRENNIHTMRSLASYTVAFLTMGVLLLR